MPDSNTITRLPLLHLELDSLERQLPTLPAVELYEQCAQICEQLSHYYDYPTGARYATQAYDARTRCRRTAQHVTYTEVMRQAEAALGHDQQAALDRFRIARLMRPEAELPLIYLRMLRAPEAA